MNIDREYQICTRCVMDTTDSEIVFDKNGHCNHCTNALKLKENEVYVPGVSEKKWEQIVFNIKAKSKGKKYDCLMGVSGGVDSSYAVYLAVQSGLRPLLMHMDNGWDSEIAVQNIKNLVDGLGLDYISEVLDWNEFREVQLAFLKSSSVDLEIPTDVGILASTYQNTAKYGLNYIISGGNASGEAIHPLTWGYHRMRDMSYYKGIVKKFGNVQLKNVPHTGVWKEMYYKFVKDIRTIYILNYFDYNKDVARTFLRNNFNWKDYGGKHHESKITAFWQGYVMPTKFNMDYRRKTYSSQICAGQLSRDEALKLLEENVINWELVDEQKKYIAKKYNISLEELNSYLNLPPKTYKDFPNSKWFIDIVFSVYKKIFKNKRL